MDRIQLIYSSLHFDIYGAEKEIPYAEPMGLNMEEQFEIQQNRFEVEIKHRINICIYDNEVGKEINNRDDFQGLACGADKINTSHLEIDDYGLMNHEFMHVLVNIISNHNPGPGQFLNEGIAESTEYFMTDEEIPFHYYKIHDLFYHYQRKYNREPTWLEIVDNREVNKEDGFWVDAYALGELYWRYMHDKYPDGFWVKVKLFMQGGRDWTVFGGKTPYQEGAEFIQFMKELASVGPPLETATLPFIEDFETSFDGWTLMRYGVDDYWQIKENDGIDESYCAYVVDPYGMEEKNVDSWLVTPPIECIGTDIVNVQFNYKQHGQGIKPEVYYAGNFTGAVAPVDWVLVEGISWDAPEGEWSEINFEIENPPNKLNVGVRYLSNEGNYTTYLIDNFSVSASQLDDDGDGVLNDDDKCANTPSGESVDANGCILLDSNNFTIKIISETCPNKDNGQIVIEAQTSNSYIATVSGVEYEFTTNKTIDELKPGDYEICIEITNQTSPYCYNITIGEGTTVSGKSSTTNNKTSVEIFEGTAPYDVLVNGNTVLRTMSSTFDIDTKHGDLIEVKTDKSCEGVYSKTVQLFDIMTLYPNPTEGLFELAIPIDLNEVNIEMYNNSQLISKRTYPVSYGKVQLDLTSKSTGLYYVKVLSDTPVMLKIIKK